MVRSTHLCPGPCRRAFASQRAVKVHLRNKHSTCREWVHRMPAIRWRLHAAQPPHDPQPALGDDEFLEEAPEDPHFEQDPGPPDPPEPVDPQESPPAATTGCVDHFPGAAATFGPLADAFHRHAQEDADADAREDNAYHPFSCKTDWELGKWFMTVNASAQSLNKFFQLRYVSLPQPPPHIIPHPPPDSIPRRRALGCPPSSP